ncbi:MAG: transcriptional repressor LexA [Chloroflexota bacterium]
MKPFDELSVRQRKILRYIDEYTVENGYPPTIREIGEATDTNSTSVVNYNLNKLVEEGYLDREQRVSRGVRLIARIPGGVGAMHRSGVKAADVAGSVPLVGSIAAGQPLPVPDDIAHNVDEDDYIEVTSMMLGGLDSSTVFALRVKGDSMIDAMVSDGDIVLIHKQPLVGNGEMAAVWLADRSETTLKFFYLEGNRVRLQPAHPYMEPIYVETKDCQVQGKVLSVIRRMR